MLYQQSIEHCQVAGDVPLLLKRLESARAELAAKKDAKAAPLFALPAVTSDLDEIEKLAGEIRVRFSHVVVAGTGGSGLSGKTLTQLKLSGASFIHYLDNLDHDTLEDVLAHVDLAKTCFIIISKSGSTAETLAQYYVLLAHVEKKLGKNAVREQFILITQPGENPLRKSAAEHGLRVLDHLSDIGGRFAVFTVVGLLPAAIAGLDIRALRRGAQTVVTQVESSKVSECAPAIGAAIQYAFMEKKYPMTVMIPYSERLTGFGAWYRQVWAESLGKDGKGTTPIPAIGTTDQHSQTQLYLDGPKDKFFTLVMLDRAGTGPRMEVPADKELGYLRGKTMGDLLAAEQKATLETLVEKKCPVRVIHLKKLGEEEMGALLMHFMAEVILTSKLMGVDAFDQPAVEQGKILARDYLLSGKL